MVIRNIQLLKYVDCFFKSSLGSLIDLRVIYWLLHPKIV